MNRHPVTAFAITGRLLLALALVLSSGSFSQVPGDPYVAGNDQQLAGDAGSQAGAHAEGHDCGGRPATDAMDDACGDGSCPEVCVAACTAAGCGSALPAPVAAANSPRHNTGPAVQAGRATLPPALLPAFRPPISA